MMRLIPFGTCLFLVLGLSCSQAQSQPSDEAPVETHLVQASTQTVPAEERAGADWPCFLGPTHDGISTETNLLDKWPKDGPPQIWDNVVGTGYSAPSILGNRLVLHHRIENEEIVECMNASTGKTLWKHAYPSDFRDPYGYNNGPRCSPILTAEHCYTLGAKGKLLCLKIDSGVVVWQRDLKSDYDIPDGFFGVGASPILEGTRLIVLVGGQPNSGVVAFDKDTGQQLWEAVGRSTWDGAETGWTSDPNYAWEGDEMVVSYSSPIAATIHGKRHVLCLMRQGLVSVDPETGAENFHHWFRARVHESVNAARPVVVNDTILLSAAYRVGSVCLTVAEDGKSCEEIWSDPRSLLTHWSTSIYLDGHYLGFSGRHENEGTLRCIDAKTGDIAWETVGFDRLQDLARGPDNEIIDRSTGETIPFPLYGRASKIMVDGKFIVLAERGGTLALLKAQTSGWEELSRCTIPQMHYPSWTAPVLSRGYLYLRCEDALVCLDLRK